MKYVFACIVGGLLCGIFLGITVDIIIPYLAHLYMK